MKPRDEFDQSSGPADGEAEVAATNRAERRQGARHAEQQQRAEQAKQRANQVEHPGGGVKPSRRDGMGSRRRGKALQILWGEAPIVSLGGGIFQVPSQSGGAPYTANLGRMACTCPYWRKHRAICKHLEAAHLFQAKERLEEEGSAIVGPLRHAFSQPWYYDRLKRYEARCVRQLLRCLGRTFIEPVTGIPNPTGHPTKPIGDIIIAGTHAAYNNKPGRKAVDDILLAEDLLYNWNAPLAPITLRRYMAKPEFTEAIREAIRRVAMCTRRLDNEFAIDSTYLKTPLSRIHLQRRGPTGLMPVKKILNCKAHFAAGLESLMIYGTTVVDGDDSDHNGFIPTLDQFARYVSLDRVLADAGYCSVDHYAYVHAHGGEAYVDFKIGLGVQGTPESRHFDAQLALWKHYRDEWLDVYSYRYLIECVNSIFKRTTKRVVRARYERQRENEILLAVLSYNLCRLVVARIEHCVEIPWADERALGTIDAIVTEARRRGRAA